MVVLQISAYSEVSRGQNKWNQPDRMMKWEVVAESAYLGSTVCCCSELHISKYDNPDVSF